MKLDRLKRVGEWLGCEVSDGEVTGFSIDSREVEKGHLFFALKGEKFDGHDFLQDVGKRGAIGAVINRSYQGETGGLILIRVDDVVEALQKLACEVQSRRRQRIIAITGSVGKTTTKEFLATLLSQKYSVAKTPGNSNSQVGLPLAILRAGGEEEVFIAEMAMTEFHQIEKLVKIAPPEIAMITKVGYSHLDTVPNGLDGIAKAKSEILMHPETKIGVIEEKAYHYLPMQQTGNFPKITYGVAPASADMVLETGWILNYKRDESPSFRLSFSESHFIENFTGAATVAKWMGLSWEEIIHGAHALKSIQLRFEKIEREGVLIVNDSYNASLDSMKAALENLPKPAFGCKTIAVLGEMLTLGSYSEEGHQQIGALALDKADHLLCYGKRCKSMLDIFNAGGKPAELFHDLKDLKTALFELCKPGDVVLVKGSNGNKLWHLLD